jgi:large subunit ribosomal protein L4
VATLKKYDLQGKEVGTVQVDDALLQATAHPQSIKDYIVAIRNNARQWSASTKGRKEINKTGKKPHPQKGQGRSRQGCLAAPQYKGGGIVFGPKPKFDQHVSINKKEKRAAIRYLLVEKIKEGRVHVLKSAGLKEPKTKKLAEFFGKLEIGPKRAMLVSETCSGMELDAQIGNLLKSVRNLPKKSCAVASQLNGYELARHQHLVIVESAIDEVLAMLGKGETHE